MEKLSFIYKKSSYTAYDAQQIVFEASKFKSEISFVDGNKRGNGKSIIGLLSMKFLFGGEYTIIAEGSDEKDAVIAVASFIDKL